MTRINETRERNQAAETEEDKQALGECKRMNAGDVGRDGRGRPGADVKGAGARADIESLDCPHRSPCVLGRHFSKSLPDRIVERAGLHRAALEQPDFLSVPGRRLDPMPAHRRYHHEIFFRTAK